MEYVTSADGARIAYERTGSGPPLVLVHGSLTDRRAWGMVLPAFQQRFTVLAMDRRGRGESGAPAPHDLERQFEDVVAVIEAAGEPVDLVGHSYGARCSMGAATMIPDRVKHLVLYEPPASDLSRAEMSKLFDVTDGSQGVERFMLDVVGVPPEQLAVLKTTPYWDYSVSFWPTMATEGAALMSNMIDANSVAKLKMPALFLVGSQTAELLGGVLRQLTAVMPQAEWVTFEGQGHAATMTAPKLFADTVLDFLAR
jgi:pimeloyl-ACP methyl ester carboxylesterase